MFDFELLHSQTPSKAVLLFHGLTGSPFEMSKYAKHLHKAGYDVYCYCLPGHGDYAQDIKSVTWKDWAAFAQEKYDKLRFDYDDFFVSGLCLGSVIALYLAQNNPEITGLVGLSTTLYLDGWTMPWYQFLDKIVLNTILRFYYTFPEREPYGIKNEAIRKKIASLMSKNTVAMDNYPMCCVYELLRLSKHVRKHMADVTCPVILFHSIKDDLTSIKSSRFVHEHISSNDKELIELKDSYHLILYDNERAFVYDKATEFCDKLSAREMCGVS